MRLLSLIWWTSWLVPSHVRAAAVFAHFMVGNVPTWDAATWEDHMLEAMDAHIDAFALDIANGWYANNASLALAFQAAETAGFQLFFSFDYAGNGSWVNEDVIALISQYGGSSAYYHYNDHPFVSTFEGPDNAEDWVTIKAQTGCFFIPDWSSLGAIPAAAAADGVADALFSWAGWPWGDSNMTTFVDASYIETLNSSGKPYMMPASPWFYTNMPGYDKNWLWRGDDTWYQRWIQIWFLQPEFVEIISWNDYGESHYIGPLDNNSYGSFPTGRAPFNYAENMPHDGWRELLPYMIDTYKNGRSLVSEEKIVTWFRTSLSNDCNKQWTTGNTASQLQEEFAPDEVAQDRLFFTALLASKADLVRDGTTFLTLTPIQSISADNCVNNLTNWNSYVAASEGLEVTAEYAAFHLDQMICTAGYSVGEFDEICQFTCSLGYCPIGACVCTNLGVVTTFPNATGEVGYPANGDANWAGLCTFACNFGYCPSQHCSDSVQPQWVPSVSPFTPSACVAGTGEGSFSGLCSYACNYGFCPENHCECTETGALVTAPAIVNETGVSLIGWDSDLCKWSCERGYCPETACARAVFRYPDNSCSAAQKSTIELEMTNAISIASFAASDFQSGPYYESFFPDSVRTSAFTSNAKTVFARSAKMLSGQAEQSNGEPYELLITCHNVKLCTKKTQQMVAFMNDQHHTMNFCDLFFVADSDPDSNDKITSTAARLEHCGTLNLRKCSRSRATVIVHESMHTRYVMNQAEPANDYAYGINGCLSLAANTFTRACPLYQNLPLLCPDPTTGKDGHCDAKYTAMNADSWALTAAGAYFSAQCSREIPISNEVPTTVNLASHLSKRDTGSSGACDLMDDFIVWDYYYSTDQVTGIVHFGDSFAAGMGTGSTAWTYCRLGSSNYGQLLYNYLDNASLPFENLACSGDTTTGLAGKVSAWKGTSSTNIGTLTVGGNDVDFSNILYYCILDPNWLTWAPYNRKWCNNYKTKARSLMADGSNDGLQYKLKEAYLSIVNTATNVDFRLYVTGYPLFFNNETSTCDSSSFHYWWGAYKGPWDWRMVYLTTALRTEMNELVQQMNSVITAAISDANTALGSPRVVYVDVKSKFVGHEFCEEGVKEPDPSRDETYFFLSGWNDVIIDSQEMTTSAVIASEVATLIADGLTLPDANTCNTTLGTDPDPYAVAMCRTALRIAGDPEGLEAQSFAQAETDIANKNYSSQDIPLYTPVRQIKSFHPRSNGMLAFRDAVLAALYF
ncbi:mutanase [Aspergillus costaricaensis CBS 115574]|uniref:Mutanase n=1 Tax=Aspergillus costaricaensis CBS 115574 TaxID=1448317 RepID=A0ACD1IN09_9EURO|nr:mutanase [Aspergillus costaricaensis CBS 115574]RAK91934.1 mutanase [Aspergillus costaricaensis CBS 115574]